MRWLIVGLLSLLLGCSQEEKPATALVISIKTDFAPGAELTEVWVRAFPRDSNAATDKPFMDVRVPVADMERPFVIEKGSDDQVLIAVQGLGTATPKNAIVEHRLLARFEGGKSLQIPVHLAKVCRDKPCSDPAGQTCYWEAQGGVPPGSCGPIPFPQQSSVLESPTDYGKWDAPDAGPADAAPVCDLKPDAGSCNPVAQCGCPMGLNCQVDTNGAGFCTDKVGTKSRGASCENELCASGFTCFYGSCVNYCAKDDDCGNGLCVKSAMKPYGRCLTRCTTNESCPGTPCTQIRVGDTDESFCLRPLDDCGEPDDLCDEPEGTGLCAEGTDRDDCACNVFTQEGCPTSRACYVERVIGTSYTTICAAPSTRPVGSSCGKDNDCQKGLLCVGSLCRRPCQTSASCGAGNGCGPVTNQSRAQLTPFLGACSIACGPTTPCSGGAVCERGDASVTGSCEVPVSQPPP